MFGLFLLLLSGTFLLPGDLRAAPERQAFLLDVSGPIGPAVSDYFTRGLEQARDEGAEVVILRLDTPGGLDQSMREIIREILSSPIPVVAYVAPSGARAASAGTYILYASHVAAMAPGTNLGAATPVQIGGPPMPFPLPRPEPEPGGHDGMTDKGVMDKERGGGEKAGEEAKKGAEEERPPAPAPHPGISEKVLSDAVAYIRSLAQMRGRNAEWAEKAVREAASLPAEEALAIGVIDLLADTPEQLLSKLDGRVVSVIGTERKLATAGLTIKRIEPDWRTQILSVITNPNVAYILMLVGIYGLVFEFYNPGLIVPGVVGAISLLLALYAFQILPINYAGLGLILLGLALMVAEAFAPSFGALGIGGVAAFVAGSVMLLETDVPGYGISWMLIGSVALVGAGFFLLVTTLFLRSRRREVVVGPEQLVGLEGEVVEWDGHEGRVRVHGEMWRARGPKGLHPGRAVRVAELDGLTLVVEPAAKRRASE